MKLIKTANKTKLKLSRKEWEKIGSDNGWMKKSQLFPEDVETEGVETEGVETEGVEIEDVETEDVETESFCCGICGVSKADSLEGMIEQGWSPDCWIVEGDKEIESIKYTCPSCSEYLKEDENGALVMDMNIVEALRILARSKPVPHDYGLSRQLSEES